MIGKALLKKTVDVEIEVSPEEVVELFWQMGGDEQASFFNHLGAKPRLPFQLQAIMDSKTIDPDGSYAMSRIGEYGDK